GHSVARSLDRRPPGRGGGWTTSLQAQAEAGARQRDPREAISSRQGEGTGAYMTRWAVAALSIAVSVAAFGSVEAGAQTASTPTATVDSTSVAIGQRLLVQGESWAPGTQVHIELCGNAATNLSAD